jgi:hypothetical protein
MLIGPMVLGFDLNFVATDGALGGAEVEREPKAAETYLGRADEMWCQGPFWIT